MKYLSEALKSYISFMRFKSNDKAFKFCAAIIYLQMFILLYKIMNLYEQWCEKLLSMIVMLILSLFLLFIVYIVVDLPPKILFKDVSIICKHIDNNIFKNEFNKYSNNDKITHFDRSFINIKEVPKKEDLVYWKYILSNKKEVSQIFLPFIVLFFFTALKAPFFADIKDFFVNFLKISAEEVDFFKWDIQMLSYFYAFEVYIYNIISINQCICKIELLENIDLKGKVYIKNRRKHCKICKK